MPGLKPLNVAGGTIVVQILLLIILSIGAGLTRRAKSERPLKPSNSWVLLYTAILSFAIVVCTSDFYPAWSPILGDVVLPTVPGKGGLAFIFLIDIVATSILMFRTGGAKDSPFTSVLFLIPALAIFLRESPEHFFLYACFAGSVYAASLRYQAMMSQWDPWDRPEQAYDREGGYGAHGCVNILCLMLTMFTGYITRPLPI